MMCLLTVLISFTSRGVRQRCRNYFMGPGGGARAMVCTRRGGMEVSPRRGRTCREDSPRRGRREVSPRRGRKFCPRRGGMEVSPRRECRVVFLRGAARRYGGLVRGTCENNSLPHRALFIHNFVY